MKAFMHHKTRLGQGLACLIIALFTLCWSITPVSTLAQDSREIMRLGRGTANALDWRPDGEVLAVGSATGVWLLDESLNIIDHPETVEAITSVAWSPDGVQVAVTGYAGEVCLTQIWDAEFSTHDDIVFCGEELAWSPDNTRLTVTQTREGIVALVDPANGTIIATLIGQSGVWSPDGKTFITSTYLSLYLYGAEEPALYVWDSVTGEQQQKITQEEYGIGNLLWSREAGTVSIWCNEIDATTNERELINICEIDVKTGEQSKTLELGSRVLGQAGFFTHLQWKSSNDILGYVIDRQTRGFLDSIIIFDPQTKENKNIGYGQTFAWKADSNMITSIVGNGLIANIDITNGEALQEQMLFTAPINSVAWRPDGEQIAAVGFGYDQDVRVWDVTQATYEPDMMWHVEPAEHVFYTPDSQELVSAGTIRTDIIINHDITAWNADTGERSRGIDGFYSQFEPFPLIAWNKDFTRSVRSDRDNKVQFSESLTITTGGSQTFNIVWSPDDKTIAVSHYSGDNAPLTIEFRDAEDGQLIYSYETTDYNFMPVWSPDGEWIAAFIEEGENSKIHILDATSYEEISTIDSGNQYTWSADSRLLAVVQVDNIVFYDAQTGILLETVIVEGVTALGWSPDGTMLALGMSDGTIRIWDVRDIGER